ALRGKVRGKLGDLKGALNDYANSLLLNPAYSNCAFAYRVGTYCAANMPEKALADLDQLCARTRVHTETQFYSYIRKGILLENLGRTSEAKKAFEKALGSIAGEPSGLGVFYNDEGPIFMNQCYVIPAAYAAKKIGDNQKYQEFMRIHNEHTCDFEKDGMMKFLGLEFSNLKLFW
ncbi:MAG: hypothetical protein K2Z81_15785, partial [Cyanobacteria bacterium]|nr:hypothetical protein [Cyanobacteriota bacterium]